MLNSELNAINQNQQLRRVNNQMPMSASQLSKRLRERSAARKKAEAAKAKAAKAKAAKAEANVVKVVDVNDPVVSSLNDNLKDINEENKATVEAINNQRSGRAKAAVSGSYKASIAQAIAKAAEEKLEQEEREQFKMFEERRKGVGRG